MKLWMSGEIDADVADMYRKARFDVEAAVNAELKEDPVGPFEKWAVIAIIRSEDDPDYDEVTKKHAKRKVVEFRLKLDHQRFLNAAPKDRCAQIFDMLERSIAMMGQLGLSPQDSSVLRQALAGARARLVNQ